jgi:hypothetical protein
MAVGKNEGAEKRLLRTLGIFFASLRCTFRVGDDSSWEKVRRRYEISVVG